MYKITALLLILFLCSSLTAQEDLMKLAKEIENEGKYLYGLERAAWLGTDILMQEYKQLTENIGGYVSYEKNGIFYCVFTEKSNKPKVLLSFGFDESFDVEKVKIDDKARKATKLELDLLALRQLATIEMETDTLFQHYSNTAPNIIPLVYNGQRKVIILTGPKVHGVVVIGNDYELLFDEKNQLLSKKAIHQNIIPIEFDPNGVEKEEFSVHSHLESTGAFITPTDICTLMLYCGNTTWEQHVVVSDTHISFWNCEEQELLILTKEAFDKIMDDQDDN